MSERLYCVYVPFRSIIAHVLYILTASRGYITAYDLPEFRPRGSFCCKDRSDVKAIVDARSEGVFLTAGLHGDIIIWRWGAAGGPTVSPFAPPGGAPGMAPQGASFGGGGMMM